MLLVRWLLIFLWTICPMINLAYAFPLKKNNSVSHTEKRNEERKKRKRNKGGTKEFVVVRFWPAHGQAQARVSQGPDLGGE